MQENQCQRLSSETADEREARVENLRANQNRRLSSDDREARLQRMSYVPKTINNHHRLQPAAPISEFTIEG